ncbi:MAG: sigma-54 dependent transcriptional regulator [Campylobacter sp.]|nr:sigma-54 dependent transcriptional regulator [Campylobacter sp.]
MRKSLEFALSEYEEFEIKCFKSALDALKKMPEDTDIVVTDINMPGMDGLAFAKELAGKYDIVIMTGNATLSGAIESLRLGVRDFLTKPFDADALVAVLRKVRDEKPASKAVKIIENPSDDEPSAFFGSSPVLEALLKTAKKAAVTDASVMINGQSGVGKELFARFIHENSPRSSAPFVAINMAAIPENLLESELYGYEKGAFTDATATKKGLFELADGGTLFLDEIGEMPANLQAKLLRVIQERELMRVGGSKTFKINVRIVSATNADLSRNIKNGEFREDLFYRLNTIPLNVPPLKERKDEIEGIASSVLKRVSSSYNLGTKKLGKDALKALLAYDYPGNIRELVSIIERAAILSESEEISKSDLGI